MAEKAASKDQQSSLLAHTAPDREPASTPQGTFCAFDGLRLYPNRGCDAVLTDIAEAALKWVHLQKDQHTERGRMTLRQIAVLGIIADNSPIDFGVLSSRLGLTKPVTTRAVYTLGQLGLVHQQIDPADHRFRIVSITMQGQDFRGSLRLPDKAG